MSTSYFQGGDFVELLSAQGKAPAAHWKLQGKIAKSFEKLIKGNAFLLDGSADTRMQLPKGGISSTSAAAALGLTQRFLVLQLLVPFTKSFSLEIGFADLQRARRRFVISSAFREPTVTALHAQIPLGAAAISRDAWINLVLDLQGLTDTFFAGSVFRSMESLAIGGSCRLKRVFTVKDPPTPTGCVSDNSTVDIPRQFVFSCGKDGAPVPTEYFLIHGQGGAAADVKPALDADGRDKRAGSAGPGVAKGKSVAVARRKLGPAANKRSNDALRGPTAARRAGVPMSQGGTPRVSSRGDCSVAIESEDVEETSQTKVRNDPARLRTARTTPHDSKKLLESRSSATTRHNDALYRSSPRQQSPVMADADDEEHPSPGRSNIKTSRTLPVRLTSAISTRSNASTRSSTPIEREATSVAVVTADQLGELNDESGEETSARPLLRPTSSRGGNGSRLEIMSEIQHTLDLLAEEGNRAGDRNRKLFLYHTTLSDGPDLDLDDVATTSARAENRLRESMATGKSVDGSRGGDTTRPTSSRTRSGAPRGSGIQSQRPKTSIFAFDTGSAGDEQAARSAAPSGLTSEVGEKTISTGISSKLFDFDVLLDSVGSVTMKPDQLAATPVEAQVEATTGLDHEDQADEDVDGHGDGNCDHELELLLAAKRAARRGQQHQGQTKVCRSASAADHHAREAEVDRPGPSESRHGLDESPLAETYTRGMGDNKRNSTSIWRFGDRMTGASNDEEAAVSGDDGGDRKDTTDECERDTDARGTGDDQDDDGDDGDDDLSIDLTGELEELYQTGDDNGEDDASRPSPSGDRTVSAAQEAPDVTVSPMRRPVPCKNRDTNANRASSKASALSTSFDFGDLVESDGEEGAMRLEVRSKPSASVEAPLLNTSTAMLLTPPDTSFDFGELTGGGKSTHVTASPLIAGDSSTSKRLQQLLESTEWRTLPAFAPDVAISKAPRDVTSQRQSESREQGKHQRRQPPASSSASSVASPSAMSNSIELVYDPVLRCYYDPVADKYYALAK